MEVKMQNYPVTLHKDVNNILLSWENIIPCEPDVKYALHIKLHEWKLLYKGVKQQYFVKNLTPSTCYTFKLEQVKNDCVVASTNFKATTDFEPYFVFHITRAIKQNKTPLLRKIISQRPILLELENANFKTPLVGAVEKGDFQLAVLLLSLGANVNSALLLNKRTPLMMALYNGSLQIADLLIDKGADINLKDCNGLTALHYAIDSNSIENVKFALKLNYDVDTQDNSGWTPLLRAVILECSDDIIQYLLSKKANPYKKDNNGFDFYQHSKLARRDYNKHTINSEGLTEEISLKCNTCM